MDRRCFLLAALAAALLVTAALAGPAAALVRNGTHGWYWQLPQPAGGSPGMTDVAFSGDKDVWTAGEGGLVMHSTDGGLSWAVQPTGSDADLWKVQFVDASHGFVCGDATVLSTIDGGVTWSDITPSAGLGDGLWDLKFVDAAHGWLTTSDGSLLRTTDAGATWTRKGIAAAADEVSCDFVDPNHGWAVADGGRLWKTANGGSSWVRQPSSLDSSSTANQVDFWDARHGWVWGYSSHYDESFVLHTSDGGAHWKRCADVWWADDLQATGPSSAWLMSTGFSLWLEPSVLEHTTDAGRHWTSSTLYTPASPTALAVRGDNVCAVGDGIIVSDDAGGSWLPASSGQAYWFSDLVAVAADDLWAVDYNGAVLHSTDGVRWKEQDVPQRWSGSLSTVCFPDADNGWVAGSADAYGEQGSILHTADGGATWEPQTSNLGGQLVGMDFIDSTTGWAISNDPYAWSGGANTCIERTTDGGQTWVPLFVANGAALSAVQFLDADHGWAAGRYGAMEGEGTPALFSTANGGFTWTKHALPKGAPEISGLQFTTATTGWAVGISYDWETEVETGWALQTTNGGATWKRVDALTDALPTAVHFLDADHGYIGGDDGVWATSDAGATWQRVAGGYGVTSIAAADADHVWAAGGGFLTSTVDGSGDTAAPATLYSERQSSWSRRPVSIALAANDTGGSGLAGITYRVDGDAAWTPGSTIAIPAPADHANDGAHTVYYRSSDNAGNREQLEVLGVGIDTLGPACSIVRPSVVDSGSTGILYFKAADANSGVAHATITVLDRHGRAALRFRLKRGRWGMSPPPEYYWWRFTCRLQPGTYRTEVRAVDWAGNRQVTVGRGELRVVKAGAPPQRHPGWPEGLPYDASGFSPRQTATEAFDWRPAVAVFESTSVPDSVRWARLMRAAH